MSDLRVTNLRGRTAGTPPTLPDGVIVSGIATATSFAGNITGTTGTFTGNVSVGGTLTYDDVTRIDSVGIVTAGGGLFVGRNEGTGTGIAVTITTVTNFETQGTLAEAFKTHTTAWNSAGNLNLSEGNLHYNSTNLGGTGAFLNVISTAGINTDLAVGQALNVTAITAVNATTAFVNALRIDGKGTGITTSWVGGSVPTAGGGSGVDSYSFNILKTASETYIVIANQSKTS